MSQFYSLVVELSMSFLTLVVYMHDIHIGFQMSYIDSISYLSTKSMLVSLCDMTSH